MSAEEPPYASINVNNVKALFPNPDSPRAIIREGVTMEMIQQSAISTCELCQREGAKHVCTKCTHRYCDNQCFDTSIEVSKIPHEPICTITNVMTERIKKVQQAYPNLTFAQMYAQSFCLWCMKNPDDASVKWLCGFCKVAGYCSLECFKAHHGSHMNSCSGAGEIRAYMAHLFNVQVGRKDHPDQIAKYPKVLQTSDISLYHVIPFKKQR